MERRKFIAGVGSLAAGGAAALGTGAFTSVTASRDIDVSVASDSAAFLSLSGHGGENSEYVASDGSSGELSIDLDAGVDGEGANMDALTEIDDLFEIKNQGSQEVDVDLEKSDEGGNESYVSFYASPSGSNGDTDRYDTGNDGTKKLSSNPITLAVGETAIVSMEIDTQGVSGLSDGDTLLDSVTVHGNAT